MKMTVMDSTDPVVNTCSPKIYNLQTPLKKSIGRDNNAILLSSDSSLDFGKKVKESLKSDKAFTTSSIDASTNVQRQVSKHGRELSLVDLIVLEESSRTKCSKAGESYCYKTCQ